MEPKSRIELPNEIRSIAIRPTPIPRKPRNSFHPTSRTEIWILSAFESNSRRGKYLRSSSNTHTKILEDNEREETNHSQHPPTPSQRHFDPRASVAQPMKLSTLGAFTMNVAQYLFAKSITSIHFGNVISTRVRNSDTRTSLQALHAFNHDQISHFDIPLVFLRTVQPHKICAQKK